MRPLAVLLLAFGLGGCHSEEAEGVAGAVETFVDFGMSNEERAKAPSGRPRPGPHANERSREVVPGGRHGPVLRVVVDLPHHLASHEVEAILGAELDRVLEERRAARVEVRALPAGLLGYGGLMGIATGEIGVDGGRSTAVRSLVDDRARTLQPEEHAALVALELAAAGARPGSREEREARRHVEEVHGRAALAAALAAARRRFPRRR